MLSEENKKLRQEINDITDRIYITFSRIINISLRIKMKKENLIVPKNVRKHSDYDDDSHDGSREWNYG